MIKLIFDDTFEGFLTAIYDGFYSKEEVTYIGLEDNLDVDMLTKKIHVKTDLIKYAKVKDAIICKIDPLALNKIYHLFLSNYINKGLICYNYLKLGFKYGSNIHKHLYLNEVKEIDLIERKVLGEVHIFTGFVRFSIINDKFLYASIEPDHNILELLSPHFADRFNNEYWIIHDIKRNIASIYNKVSWEITEMNDEIYSYLKNHNDEFEDLWRSYFKSATIKERLNPKLQRKSMPKRYWNNLTELQ